MLKNLLHANKIQHRIPCSTASFRLRSSHSRASLSANNAPAPRLHPRFQQTANEANTVFRSARDLITDGDSARAQEKFNQYVTSYPNEKNIEAALYWLAYSQHKLAQV